MKKDVQITSWGKIDWLHRPKDADANISIGIVTVNPMVKQLEHIHFSDEQCLITISGEGIDYINGKPIETNIWGANYFPVGCAHYTENTKAEPLKQILISSPIKNAVSYGRNFDEDNLNKELSSLNISDEYIDKYMEKFTEEFDWNLAGDIEFPICFFSANLEALSSEEIPEICSKVCDVSKSNVICEKSLEHYVHEIRERKDIRFDTIVCPYERFVILYEINLMGKIIGYLQCGYFKNHVDIVESTLDGILKVVSGIAEGIRYECKEKIIKYALEDGLIQLAEEREKNNLMELTLEQNSSRLLTLDINNHFLFNTLTAIGALAIKDGSMQTYNAILDLSAMFRGKLQKSGTMVELEFDMDNIKTYIALMKLRLYSDVDVRIDIPDNCKGLKVPYNMIQPIVENSMIHGFKENLGRLFLIEIKCEKNKEKLIITVSDNGCGMNKAQLENLRDSACGEEPHGLSMVYTLLKKVYKSGFKVSVNSRINKGTEFIVILPLAPSE
ncbi:MAG: histidine kinase [Anaerovoracaceae bacterium]